MRFKKHQKGSSAGYALPAVITLSSALFILGLAVVQNSLAIRTALVNQYYDRIAREAGEAGSVYANYCVAKGTIGWTAANPLQPNTDCNGNTIASPSYVASGSGWQSTFSIGPLTVNADGSSVASVAGAVNLQTTAGSTYRTYNQTVKSALSGQFTQVTPQALSLNGGPSYNYNCFLGTDSQVYCVGDSSVGEMGNGTTSSTSSWTQFQLPAGLTAKSFTYSAHGDDTFVLASNNQVYGAGENQWGMLGNGTTTDASTPVKFNLPAGLTAKKVYSGNASTFVLASDNNLYATGFNNYGQLGVGSTTQKNTPTKVIMPAGVTVQDVALSAFSNLFLGSNNQVYGAGENYNGMLGNGTTTQQNTPVKFTLAAGLTAQKVTANNYDAFVLASDSNVYGAGDGGYYDLGNGSTTGSSTPVKFGLPAGVTALDVTTPHNDSYSPVFVLGSNHQVYGDGYNVNGQLGNGTTTSQSAVVKFILPAGLTAISLVETTDKDTTAVIASDHQMYMSGTNTYGQLGNGNTTDQSTPVKFQLPSGVSVVSAINSAGHPFVIATDGNMYGAGYNTFAVLGDGTWTQRTTPVAAAQPIIPYTALSAQNISVTDGDSNFNTICAVASDGQAYCSGYNGTGGLGDGTTTSRSSPVKFQLPSGLSALSVQSNSENICVTASDFSVYCSGANASGQLGNGTTTNQSTPVKFQLPSGLTARSPGTVSIANLDHICVIASDNFLYCAGANATGQLGNGNTTRQTTPVKFLMTNAGSGATVISVQATVQITCIVATDHFGYCAGSGGQLGNGNSTAQSTPVKFLMTNATSGAKVQSIFVGGGDTCILASDNFAYCAGPNESGQLGNGNTTDQLTPVKFLMTNATSGATVNQIQVGAENGFGAFTNICILASDNFVYCSGGNADGQLGIGSTTSKSTPVKFLMTNAPSGATVNELNLGYLITCVLASDNQQYCAGVNSNGELGNGNTTNQSTAVKFLLTNAPSGATVQSVRITGLLKKTTSNVTNCVLVSDDQVYCAGRNTSGQTGSGTTTNQSTPVQFTFPSSSKPQNNYIF